MVTLEQLERELERQNEACAELFARLSALGTNSRVVFSDAFLDELLSMTERTAPAPVDAVSFFIRA